jgi:hypothetical protein
VSVRERRVGERDSERVKELECECVCVCERERALKRVYVKCV